MPRLANRNAGIKTISPGNYQARVFHNGKEESKNFKRLDDAQRWQRNLKADLERCPQDIQRSKRKWVGTLVIPTGVISKEFEALNDAIKWVDQGKVQVSFGTWVDPDQQDKTLDAYVITWRATKSATSGKTLGTYDSQFKNHIKPTFGNKKLTAITTADIKNWIAGLEQKGVGSTTIRQSYRLLHQILESAMVDELIIRNPAIGVRLPKKTKSKTTALTVQQVKALADECGKYGVLIRFLALTGMRINETLALRVEDIDLTQSVVYVSKTWTATESGKKLLGQTKTREVRDIPLAGDLVAELKASLAGKAAKDWAFQGAGGDALDYGYFRRAHFQPAVERLGLQEVTIHTLRHTCASLLISMQAPITTVSQILGHSSVKMTLDTYGHYYKDDASNWILRLSKEFHVLTNH